MQLSNFNPNLIDDFIPSIKALPQEFWSSIDDWHEKARLTNGITTGIHFRHGRNVLAINPDADFISEKIKWPQEEHHWCFFNGKIIHLYLEKTIGQAQYNIFDFYVDSYGRDEDISLLKTIYKEMRTWGFKYNHLLSK